MALKKEVEDIGTAIIGLMIIVLLVSIIIGSRISTDLALLFTFIIFVMASIIFMRELVKIFKNR